MYIASDVYLDVGLSLFMWTDYGGQLNVLLNKLDNSTSDFNLLNPLFNTRSHKDINVPLVKKKKKIVMNSSYFRIVGN